MKKFLLSSVIAVPLLALGTVALWQVVGDEPRSLASLSAPTREPLPLAWRGAWSAEEKYQPGEVVSHGGSSYVAQTENAEVEPGSCPEEGACAWALLAVDTGDAGSLALAGQSCAEGSSVTGFSAQGDLLCSEGGPTSSPQQPPPPPPRGLYVDLCCDFGHTPVGEKAPDQQVRVMNVYDNVTETFGPLTVSIDSTVGSFFTISDNTCDGATLPAFAAGEAFESEIQCRFDLGFKPEELGTYNFRVVVHRGGELVGESEVRSGTGVAPATESD